MECMLSGAAGLVLLKTAMPVAFNNSALSHKLFCGDVYFSCMFPLLYYTLLRFLLYSAIKPNLKEKRETGPMCYGAKKC